MNASLWAWTGFCAALSGFGALSLAMDRHFEDIYGRGTSPGAKRRWLQLLGTLALLASLLACLLAQGTAQGWVLWCGVLTVAALLLLLLLCYAPRWAPRVTVLASVAALLVLAVFLWHHWGR